VGEVISAPVTEKLAACIDGLPTGTKLVLKRVSPKGRQYVAELRLREDEPVVTYASSKAAPPVR
jgi:hypothetical protein